MNPKTTVSALGVALALGAAAVSIALEPTSVEEGRGFWSFQPIADPAPPEVRDSVWPKGDIDRFVLARLEAAGEKPAAEADRRTLARRLYFDLVGLPPTPEQIESFVDDASPEAYEKLVDRLLASRHFGERWGRHWLDVARFSETTGGGRDMPLPNAWRYRDYVIDAFNRDKPFDRFLIEQIAGDLLASDDPRARREGIVATGFLALGPSNYENQDKELLRMDVVDEQIDTVGRAFMGMTLGCARCHDHFFDPVPTRDYYALAGIFRSTKTLTHANVSTWIKTPLPPVGDEETAVAKQQDDWERKRGDLRASIARLEKTVGPQPSPAAPQPEGIVIDDKDAKLVGRWTESTSVRGFVGVRYLHDDASGPGENRATFETTLPASGDYEVRVSYTVGPNRTPQAAVSIRHANGEDTRQVDQRRNPAASGFHSVGRYPFKTGEPAVVTISKAKPGSGHLIVDAVAFVPADGGQENGPECAAPDTAAALEQLRSELAAHEKKKPKSGSAVAMSVVDETETADYAVNIGGNPHKLGDPVPRGFLQVLSRDGASPPQIPDGQSGRLELARWLASPGHPLTARVFANRTWYWLTGRGIVPSVDNFGSTGEAPTHPELLDHLASGFVKSGWSVKSLVREIVTSGTYRQATQTVPNALFAGFPVRRLDAEAMRDAMLHASGEIDLAEAPVPPDAKARVGKHLRSVYLPIGRNNLPEVFALFDFPDPNLSVGARSESTLPTQALFLMNHPWVVDRSAAAAKRWAALPGGLDAKVDAAFRNTLGRAPDATEAAIALEFLGESPDSKTWTAFQQTLFASIAFRHLR